MARFRCSVLLAGKSALDGRKGQPEAAGDIDPNVNLVQMSQYFCRRLWKAHFGSNIPPRARNEAKNYHRQPPQALAVTGSLHCLTGIGLRSLLSDSTAHWSLGEVPSQILAAHIGQGDRTANVILWQLRLPMALLAALARAEMPTVPNNPLVEPYTLGVSSSALLGAKLGFAVTGRGYGRCR